MTHYEYLIIGGGMTADAAVAGMREIDPGATIGLFSAENHPPYNRPPLSKGLWKGKPLEKIYRKASSEGVDLHLGRMIQAINPSAHQVTDDLGGSYSYGKLLLATGGSPRRLPFGGDQVIYFRDLDDYFHLQQLVEKRDRRRLYRLGDRRHPGRKRPGGDDAVPRREHRRPPAPGGPGQICHRLLPPTQFGGFNR